jgi:uncharacterized membrane protein
MRLFWLVLGVLLLPAASAYYADVTVDVGADGFVSISGVSNHPQLQSGTTQDFTAKNKEHWLLNITPSGSFEDYVFTVQLPPGATLNYVNSKNLQILTEDKRVVIKVIGSNDSVSIVAQYTITQVNRTYKWVELAVILALLFVGGVLYLTRRKPKEHKKAVHSALVEGLPARQQEIVALLHKAGGKLTQKQIEQSMSIPKSSVSRNIDSLERRGVVKKDSYGMTNVISLVEKHA